MNSTVATELTEKPAARSLLETWGKNERMRHIPPLEWIVHKLDRDLRQRIAKLSAALSALPPEDARRVPIEAELRGICRSIDRLADMAKYTKPSNHAPTEIQARIEWAVTHAVSCLNTLDANLFGRRYPFQSFERSNGEPIYGALLTVIDRAQRLTELVRAVDPRIDEQLYADLVSLQVPMRAEAMA